ncbi:hypothetical protein [Blastomonas aquatica]|uniref:Uncharacterized protein n=1 Tax=Blastomonas aquatica TaxID=1510276 RepID=A0ABQ1JBB7_9SPHN|nr:hypothetical protein [Blastomonas aquatica]GGB62778.1 hypothetical protein GCM10010833_17210 [Blastomonas aquatica]
MRAFGMVVLLSVACSSAVLAKPGPQLPEELVLSGDNIIDVTINGEALRLEVRPEAADAPTLNPEAAVRLGLKPGMLAFRSMVGSERVNGNSAIHKVDYGAGEKNQRIFWADRASSSLADGTISPASLPYKRIKFLLGNPSPTEKNYQLALDNFGFLGRLGVGTTIDLEGEKLRFQFSLQRNETLASAPTGNWLAQKRDGKFTGEPKQTLIYYGITRPTRAMTLSKPVPLGPAQLTNVDVRYSDYGDASGIAAEGGDGADSDEIVVVGKKDKKVDLRIVAGRRFLQGCSALVYDMQQRMITLRCEAR